MLSQGDVLLIPIPLSDLSSVKKRPVMVLSNDKYNSITDDIIVIAITSNLGSKFSEVHLCPSDMADGEIKVESALRVDKIYTISQSIVVKKLGKLKPEKIVEVKNKFKEFF